MAKDEETLNTYGELGVDINLDEDIE